MFYGHAMFIFGNSQKVDQKGSRYLSFPVYRCHVPWSPWIQKLNSIWTTLYSVSSVKKFAAARWMPKLVSIDTQSYAALTLQSLRATIGPLQDNWPLFHYVIGISGILPYNRNVTLQALELFFRTFARLYNAAASPASRLRSAGSLAINVQYQGVGSVFWPKVNRLRMQVK